MNNIFNPITEEEDSDEGNFIFRVIKKRVVESVNALFLDGLTQGMKLAARSINDLFFATVEVVEGDEAYEWVENWLKKKITKSNIVRISGSDDIDSESAIQTSIPEGKTYHIINSKFVIAERLSRSTFDKYNQQLSSQDKIRLSMLFGNVKTLSDEISKMKAPEIIYEENEDERRAELWINSGAYLQNHGFVPKRNLSTVAVSDEVIDNLLRDILNFYTSEEKYNKRGIPWSRGYLLYGLPGTGKTSLIKSLSHELKRNLVYIDMNSVSSGSTLNELMSRVRRGNFVVFEDVDNDAPKRGEKDKNSVNLSSLLNILDGFLTREGVIYFLTTNDINGIDPALLRSGRIDYFIEFGYAKSSEIAKFCSVYLDISEKPGDISEVYHLFDRIEKSNIVMADVQVALQTSHLYEVKNYDEAAEVIWKYLVKVGKVKDD